MQGKNICMQDEEYKYTLRSAAIIVRNGALLTAHYAEQECNYLVGGGVQAGESSLEAIRREMNEELGCELPVIRLLYVQERFYAFEGRKHQETCFYYLVDGSGLTVADGDHTDQLLETLHWIPLDQIKNTQIVPLFLKEALDELPETLVHVISRE